MTALYTDTTADFIVNITSGAKNFPIKMVNDTGPIISNMYERHQELILADLQCSNTVDTFTKVVIFKNMNFHESKSLRVKIFHSDKPVNVQFLQNNCFRW